MKKNILTTNLYLILLSALFSLVNAQDALSKLPNNFNVSVKAGKIDSTLETFVLGDECNDKNGKISHLIWRTNNLPVIYLSATEKHNKKLKSVLSIELSNGKGQHAMTDYDYIWPTLDAGFPQEVVDYDWQSQYEWTHRSIHPNTRQAYYCQLGSHLDYTLYKSPRLSVSVLFGAKGFSTKWSAYEGTYKYWDGYIELDANERYNMQFDEWAFEDGVKCISLRAESNTLFFGLNTAFDTKKMQIELQTLFGSSVTKAIDKHYLRELRFEDKFVGQIFYSIQGSLKKKITNNLSIICQIEHKGSPLTRGHTSIYDETYNQCVCSHDGAGIKMKSTRLVLGVEYL